MWQPDFDLLAEQRTDCIRTYQKLLESVKMKLASGVYDLNKWRRILHNMKPKNHPLPGAKKGQRRKGAAGEDEQANKKKLSNIVNKILASKTNDEDNDGMGAIMAGSDNEHSENSADNYNIYG